MSSTINEPSKLYVGDLGLNNKSDLTRLFSKYGKISTIYCDEIKHFAFIEFSSSAEARRALERTNRKSFNGSKLRVEFAKPDKSHRNDFRRAPSPNRLTTPLFHDRLEFTANRLPIVEPFRRNYPHSTTSSSRGRSLTPPSLKFLSKTAHFRPAENNSPTINDGFNSYRTFNDHFSMRRLPNSSFFSSKRRERRRTPSIHRNSSSDRDRSSREKSRRARSKSSSSSSDSLSENPKEKRKRGPQTPPPERKRRISASSSELSASESESKKNRKKTKK